MSNLVCVMIPTFCRPDGLARAARSVFMQEYSDPFDVLIIDNDPAASAAKMADILAAEAPEHIRFTSIHEPHAGVSNARNRGLDETKCQLIAFLDDDQSAPVQWLGTLLQSYERYPAAVTFGPVITALPEHTRLHRRYFETFFARSHQGTSGFTHEYYGCGNALLDRKQMPDISPLFDPGHNETGGEDDVLFTQIHAEGGRFAWCAEAPVSEHVPIERAKLDYTLRRAFSYGQGPIARARRLTPPRWDKVAFWMALGLVKAVANGVAYGVLWIVRAPGRAIYLDLAARGVGKLFWWHDLRFYGAARLENRTRGAARTS